MVGGGHVHVELRLDHCVLVSVEKHLEGGGQAACGREEQVSSLEGD